MAVERPLRSEGPDMQLIQNILPQRDTTPGAVVPVEMRVDDLRGTMDILRLAAATLDRGVPSAPSRRYRYNVPGSTPSTTPHNSRAFAWPWGRSARRG